MTWTLVGQDAAVSVLRRAVETDRVSHAYLFAGPKHVGKTVAAMQFAQLLNCTAEERPCGRCRACDRIAAGAHPDLEFVGIGGICDEEGHKHAADDSSGIRICQVRRVSHLVARAPYEARYRVFIIEPADALGRESAAALLKTLEEPPPHVVIILVTDREEMLPDTIRSRARRVAFTGLPKEAIERALRTRWDVDPPRAADLARLSGGRLGWAVAALHDEKMLEEREAALERAETLANGSLAQRFAYAGSLGGGYSKDRAGTQLALEMWQEWWRDVLLIAAGREQQAVHRDRLDRLHVFASHGGVAPAIRALRAITDARQQLVENGSPVLVLEMMMLALP